MKTGGANGGEGVDAAELAFMDYFVRVAQGMGLSRSLGELFGFLYAQAGPVAFEEILGRLGQSKGSVSQGLRTLKRIRAVRTEYRHGDRRTYYSAETSLRSLFAGLMEETVLPHLRSSNESLGEIETLVDHLASDNPDRHAVLADRLGRLRNWSQKSQTVLPLLLRLFPSTK